MLEFSNPQMFSTKVLGTYWLTKSVLKVDLELLNPSEIYFIPGQFINVEVSANTFRSYSICSDLRNTTIISIVASVTHIGIGANFLKSLNINDRVNIIGPSGRFVLSDDYSSNLLFVATGTGLCPFISMLYKLCSNDTPQKITLLFGHRKSSDLIFLNDLSKFKSKLINFNYEVFLSKPEGGWKGKTGRVTDFLYDANVDNTQVYLCGNPNMVEDSIKILIDKNVASRNIFYEKYKRAN